MFVLQYTGQKKSHKQLADCRRSVKWALADKQLTVSHQTATKNSPQTVEIQLSMGQQTTDSISWKLFLTFPSKQCIYGNSPGLSRSLPDHPWVSRIQTEFSEQGKKLAISGISIFLGCIYNVVGDNLPVVVQRNNKSKSPVYWSWWVNDSCRNQTQKSNTNITLSFPMSGWLRWRQFYKVNT